MGLSSYAFWIEQKLVVKSASIWLRETESWSYFGEESESKGRDRYVRGFDSRTNPRTHQLLVATGAGWGRISRSFYEYPQDTYNNIKNNLIEGEDFLPDHLGNSLRTSDGK